MKNKILNKIIEKCVVDTVNSAYEFSKANPEVVAKTCTTLAVVGSAAKEKINWKEVSKKTAKSGALGASLDGVLSISKIHPYYKEGKVDKVQYTHYVAQEIGGGFVSTSAGTLGTSIGAAVLGASGSAPMLIGLGSAIGARYLYRNVLRYKQWDIDLNDLNEEPEDFQEEEEDDEVCEDSLNSFQKILRNYIYRKEE